jgi:ribosome-associated protein
MVRFFSKIKYWERFGQAGIQSNLPSFFSSDFSGIICPGSRFKIISGRLQEHDRKNERVNRMTDIQITTEYITLGQFLQVADLIQTGGMAKWFLSEYEVFVNDEQDQRRGRKLRSGDKVEIPGIGAFRVTE